LQALGGVFSSFPPPTSAPSTPPTHPNKHQGPNIARDVGEGELTEAVLGYQQPDNARLLRQLFETPSFLVTPTPDAAGVEMCGTLKNVVALAAGFVDGCGMGVNAKATVMRAGLDEMRRLAKALYPTVRDETFFLPCGVADLVATCFGGRNRLVAAAFAEAQEREIKIRAQEEKEGGGGGGANNKSMGKAKKTLEGGGGGGKTFEELERELLSGQKLQGVLTTLEVAEAVAARGWAWRADYPLFARVHDIVTGRLPARAIVGYADAAVAEQTARRRRPASGGGSGGGMWSGSSGEESDGFDAAARRGGGGGALGLGGATASMDEAVGSFVPRARRRAGGGGGGTGAAP
jgi:glycerol-3-phosphate dehydrogenase